MDTLKIKTKTGEQVLFLVKQIPGSPSNPGSRLYELVDSVGQTAPASLQTTDATSETPHLYDCVEVVNSEAFAYRRQDGVRLDKLGTEVGNG